MTFYEFLLQSKIQLGPITVNGAGTVLFSTAAALFAFKFGSSIVAVFADRKRTPPTEHDGKL